MTLPVIIQGNRIFVQTVMEKPSETVQVNSLESQLTRFGLLIPSAYSDGIIFDYVENGHLRVTKQHEEDVVATLIGPNRVINVIVLKIDRTPKDAPNHLGQNTIVRRIIYHPDILFVRAADSQREKAMLAAVKLTPTLEEAVALYSRVIPCYPDAHHYLTFDELDELFKKHDITHNYMVSATFERSKLMPRLADRAK